MFAKVFGSLWTGSMVGQADLQLVFVFLLARCDPDGFVDEHPRVISSLTGIPLDRVESALRELESPDRESRSPDLDGRRIVLRDEHRSWGWSIVNHAKYRAMRNEEVRREQNREASRRYRDNHGTNVSSRQQPSAESAHTEAEADTERTKPCRISSDDPVRNDWKDFFELIWQERPRHGAPGPTAAESKKLALRSWQKACPKGIEYAKAEALARSIRSALRVDVAAMRAEGREASKCPHLATWLNQERWAGGSDGV